MLPFLSAWLSSTIERIDKAGDAFVDWASPAEPDWLWIGQGDVLFERTLSEHGSCRPEAVARPRKEQSLKAKVSDVRHLNAGVGAAA